MPEKSAGLTHTERAILDIGDAIGALIVYFRREMCHQQIEVSPKERQEQRTHTDVLERYVNGSSVFAALFLALPADEYIIWDKALHPVGEVTVTGGQVAEVDWRHLLPEIMLFPLGSDARSICMPSQLPAFPPARDRNGSQVSAVPMSPAPLLYDNEGQVAWGEMWTDFCDLALAGGPPHRGRLLEPVSPQEICADQEAYARVLAEIQRGLEQITGLPILHSKLAGWIGLQCSDEEMALWMLRAIIVENVCVRREGCVLWLPAGPSFRLEKEIKSIITVVAKTHHYWMEHGRR